MTDVPTTSPDDASEPTTVVGKTALFAIADAGPPTAVVEVEGVGGFKVRGMTRAEHLDVGQRAQDSLVAAERYMLATCLVEPSLTDSELKTLYGRLPSSVFEPLGDKIRELSGIDSDNEDEADKQVVHRFPE